MQNSLLEFDINCPYCGEYIVIFVDSSEPNQTYTEDCSVCCRPMVVTTTQDHSGDILVNAASENDA